MYIALFAGLLCVTAPADAMPVSFAHEVQPLLTRLGCNQGACHGAQLGQGGFKLSLRAFDDIADQREIVRGANGRRVDLNRPENSLFCAKQQPKPVTWVASDLIQRIPLIARLLTGWHRGHSPEGNRSPIGVSCC